MYKLVIQDDEGKTTVVPLIRDEITVGRKEGNTIRLTERNVSRRHARIVHANSAIAIEDLDSYNGVRVNGTRIQGRHELSVSDRVQIGDYLIEIKSESDGAVEPHTDHNKTQPMPEPMTGESSRSSIPVFQDIGTPTAETRKVPAQLTPSGPPPAQAVMGGAGGGAQMVVPASPEPTVRPATPPQAVPKVQPQPQPSPPQTEAQPEPDRFARLTVLSNNFAGSEYELLNPEMVIGRTDENDIIINHRSISRHHAKLFRENGRYVILDLQSSNGVRVNGEEYGKVELHRGDLIDLGHVRMRFSDPEDSYQFKPEDINDVTVSSGKGLWYALLAVLVLIGGIGVFSLMNQGDGDQGQVNDPRAAPDDTTSQRQVAGNATPGESGQPEDIQRLLQEAQTAFDNRQWGAAQTTAGRVAYGDHSDDAAKQEAQAIFDQARQEIQNQERYEELQGAAKSKDYPAVAEALATIDRKSVIFKEAQAIHDKARDAYTNEVVTEARKLLDGRKCAQLSDLAKRAAVPWPEAGDRIAAMARQCRASSPRRTVRRPPTAPQGNSNETPTETRSFEDVMAEAQSAAKSGQYQRARRLCNRALRMKPGDQQAVSVCGIAACNLKDVALAKRYHNMAIGPRRDQIFQICLIKGLNIRE